MFARAWGRRGSACRKGAIAGGLSWAAYAVCETLFLTLIAWIAHPGYDYQPQHWGFTLLAFAVLPAIGAVSGAVCALAVRDQDIEPCARFTLIAAFGVNLGLHFGDGFGLTPAAIVTAGLAAAVWMSTRRPQLEPVTNPWTTAALLVGSAWIGKDAPLPSHWIRLGATALYVAMAVLLSAAAARFFQSPLRRRLVSVGFAATVLVLAWFPDQAPLLSRRLEPAPAAPSGAPNVLLITLDTVRADHLPLYGYPRDTTPNLRRFASEATLYTRAIAASDMTLSSHASIFTSLWPSQHGAHLLPEAIAGDGLANRFQTLAEILRDAGYSTAAVVANSALLSHEYGFDQGFEHFERLLPVPFLGNMRHYYLQRVLRDALARFAEPWQSERLLVLGEQVNRRAFQVLNNVASRPAPWLLFLNYMDAHHPYAPPPQFARLFWKTPTGGRIDDYLGVAATVNGGKRVLTQLQRQYAISQYDGGIAYEDYCLGQLFERLKEIGVYDRTLIIVTSDHGEAFGEKGLMTHGVSVYQNQVKVPLLIRYPGARGGAVVKEIVSAVDLLPTVLDVAGLPVPAGLQGVSLRSDIGHATRMVLAESYPSYSLYRMHPRFRRTLRAIFSGTTKLIASTSGAREFYDLVHDPTEETNLYSTAARSATVLSTALADWMKRIPSTASSAAPVENVGLERLRSLGYVQ